MPTYINRRKVLWRNAVIVKVQFISMTMDIYSHVLPGMQQDAVSRLDNLLVGREDGGVVEDG